MDFLKLASERYSVRTFEDKPVEDDKLQKILEAGRVAPSAKNIQPVKVYVLKSEDALKKINDITPAAFHAPVVLLICTDEANSWVNPFDNFNSAVMDASIMNAHMMLEAKDLGLGTTWVCWFDTAKVKEVFNIPDGIQPRCMLPIGYPSAKAVPGPMHANRKALSEYVTEL